MEQLLENTSNEGLRLAKSILTRGTHVLGHAWTDQLTQPDADDLNAINSVLPGLPAQFRTATPQEVAQLPRIVDPQLLEGTTVNFSRSLIRLAWMLQHVETLLPMAGEIQAELNCHTAGVSDSHAWGLCLWATLSCCQCISAQIEHNSDGCLGEMYFDIALVYYHHTQKQRRTPCRHIRNGTSCASPHGQINCPADIVSSYR